MCVLTFDEARAKKKSALNRPTPPSRLESELAAALGEAAKAKASAAEVNKGLGDELRAAKTQV